MLVSKVAAVSLIGAVLALGAPVSAASAAAPAKSYTQCTAIYKEQVKRVEQYAQAQQQPWLDRIAKAKSAYKASSDVAKQASKDYAAAKRSKDASRIASAKVALDTAKAAKSAAKTAWDNARNEAMSTFNMIFTDANDMVQQLKEDRASCKKTGSWPSS